MGVHVYRALAALAAGAAAWRLAHLLPYRSEAPVFLGRYSTAYAAYLALHALVCASLTTAVFLPSARVRAAGAWARRGIAHLAPRLAVLGVTLVMLGLAGEGIVRLAGGLGCHPTLDTLMMDVEGTRYRLNGAGYRDVEHDPAKPPGAFRLLILGDSVAFGQGVPEAQTWGRRLPEELRRRGAAPIEVINAGRIGWDTVRELGELERYGLFFSPDLVLVSFVLNDADWWDPGYYELHRPVPAFIEPALGWSCLYRFAKRRYNGVLVRTGLARSYAEHQREVFREESAGWRRCREALGRIVSLSRDRGAKVACVIWPLLSDERPYPLRTAHDRVAQALAAMGVPALDLEPLLAQHPADTLKVLGEEDPHPGAKACGLAAGALAEFLVARRLVAIPGP